MIHEIKRKVRGSNVAIKLDMKKAYDSVNWIALMKVTRKLGFCETWIYIIWRNINNCWYLVLIKRQCYGYFKSNKRHRQGDPLSPYLYIILNEVFSRGIQALQTHHKEFQFYTGNGILGVSHLA